MKLLAPWSVCQRIALYPTSPSVAMLDGVRTTRQNRAALMRPDFREFCPCTDRPHRNGNRQHPRTHAPVEFANIILLLQSRYGWIPALHPNGVQQYVAKNYFNSDTWRGNESIAFNITKFWETNNSFVLNRQKTLFATLNYWYQFPAASDLDDNDAYSQLDIGFRVLLVKKKLTISTSGTDLLKTNHPRAISYNNSIKNTFHNYYDNRKLNVALTYRFGNDKIKEKRRGGSNQTKKNRLNLKNLCSTLYMVTAETEKPITSRYNVNVFDHEY